MSKSSTVLEILKRPTNYFFLNFIVELVRNILNLEEYSDQLTEVANKKIWLFMTLTTYPYFQRQNVKKEKRSANLALL